MTASQALEWYDKAIDNAIDYLCLDRDEADEAWNALNSLIEKEVTP